MFQEMPYVYEVYRQHSFSKAAEKLYLSQPALSLMVKKAEERIGGPLFDRSTKPVRLTEAGKEYIRAAQQIMAVEEGFRQYLSDTEACLTGSLSLGGTTLFTSYVLPPLISAFSDAYPKVEILVHETHTALLEKELRGGELDFVMMSDSFDPNVYESRPYLPDRLVLTVPAQLPVNEQLAPFRLTAEQIKKDEDVKPVRLSRFKNETFLMLKEGNDTRQRAERLCQQEGFRPKVRLLLDQQITAYNLSSFGLGISFLSDTLIKSVPPEPRLCYYRLEGELARRNISLVYKRNRMVSKPMRAFLDIMEQRGGPLGEL